MALYTRKGDKGTTKLFKTKKGKRISKNSPVFEALGSLDELNSFLGLCKVKTDLRFKIKDLRVKEIVHVIQKNLFIVQAELGGSDMTIGEEKVKDVERIIDAIEEELPTVKTFFIPGGALNIPPQSRGAVELACFFDVARALARRTERRVVSVVQDKKNDVKVGEHSLAYVNRLSSLLYALTRLINHKCGIIEQAPDYK